MADVKWIKITTNMFEDEKIDFIESLPEADAILVVWIKLLTMAGRCNTGGYLLLTENIPYTTEMLSHKFRRPLNTVRLALETLQRLDMITLEGESFKITNWKKHQNIEGLEKIREQTRKRVEKHRQKQLSNVTGNVTVTQGNATELELEEELDIDKELQESSNSFSDTEFQDIVKLYSENIELPNQLTSDWIIDTLNDYGYEWFKNAIIIANQNGKRKQSYIKGILDNWKTNGGMKLTKDKPSKITKIQQDNQADELFERIKQKQNEWEDTHEWSEEAQDWILKS